MKFITAHGTDRGELRRVNQDSLLIMQGDSGGKRVLLAAVCDGMGGLEQGEEASSCVVRFLELWFREDLPELMQDGFAGRRLYEEWNGLIRRAHRELMNYGNTRGIRLGTTCAAILIFENCYYVMNVGDSRVYRITDRVNRLTHDQTYAQREADLGRITARQAEDAFGSNLLLQCIGTGYEAVPDFVSGAVSESEVYLLCSDGFRHLVSEQEFLRYLNPSKLQTKRKLREMTGRLIKMNRSRGETDNISAILIRTY